MEGGGIGIIIFVDLVLSAILPGVSIPVAVAKSDSVIDLLPIRLILWAFFLYAIHVLRLRDRCKQNETRGVNK